MKLRTLLGAVLDYTAAFAALAQESVTGEGGFLGGVTETLVRERDAAMASERAQAREAARWQERFNVACELQQTARREADEAAATIARMTQIIGDLQAEVEAMRAETQRLTTALGAARVAIAAACGETRTDEGTKREVA